MLAIYFISLSLLFTSVYTLMSDSEVSLTIRVDPGKVECMYIPIVKENYRVLEMNYLVYNGGDQDINFSLQSPSGEKIIDDKRARTHSHRVGIDGEENPRGDYIVCMDNSFSTISHKTVSISAYIIDGEGNYLADIEGLESGDPGTQLHIATEVFDKSTLHIRSNMNRVEAEMKLMGSITKSGMVHNDFTRLDIISGDMEKAWQMLLHVGKRCDQTNGCHLLSTCDRSKAEDNYEAVNFWGVINTIVMVSSACSQVYLVRSLLTENSKLGRLLRG